MCSLYASVQDIVDSPFFPHRVIHSLQFQLYNFRGAAALLNSPPDYQPAKTNGAAGGGRSPIGANLTKQDRKSVV